MAGGLIDELFVKLGFQVDDKEVKSFDNNLKATLASATRFATAVAATVVVIDHMATSLIKSNQAFLNFNQQTGLAIANAQKLAVAGGVVTGASQESILQSVQSLQSNLAQIQLGQGNIQPFQLLGISPVGKDAYQVIDELRSRIEGLDEATAVNIIQQLGLSPEFITILKLTNSELEELNGLMLSPEQRQAMQQYAFALRKVHLEFNLLKDQALIAIMPALLDFLKGFKAIAQVTYNVIDGFQKMLEMIPALKIVFAGLAIAIIAAFNPVIATVTALYLLLEDISVWAMGGKSLLGTTFGIIGDKLGEVGKFFGDVTRNIGNFITPQQTLDNSLSMAGGGASAQISHAQNMTQNNYMAFGDAGSAPIAQKASDLMFAMMQVDRTA